MPIPSLAEHFKWVSGSRKYKPIKVLELLSNCDNFDEDKYTLKYMEKYGINNVRGGSFCEVKLSEENKNTIKKMLDGSTDKCYICGENGHFANKCPHDYDKILEELEVTCPTSSTAAAPSSMAASSSFPTP